MDLVNHPALRWYFRLYQFVGKTRLKKHDLDPRVIHSVLVVVITTSMLMWAYAFLALKTIDSLVPGIVGILCSTVHLLTPLIFRKTNNAFIPCNLLLGAGAIHQATFSYYSGGFLSNVLIWFGILPLIGGVICGKKGAMTWICAAVSISLIMFYLYLSGHQFPDYISESGRMWSQILLVFGWIYLSGTIVIVYAGLREHTELLLQSQNKQVDELFRVLFHDLANPLGRIAIGLSIAKRQIHDSENNRGIEIAQLASDSMLEITQNIRKMYAARKGKTNLDLSLTPLNSAIDYIMKVYSGELEKKNITINYHFDKNEGLGLLVEPVSFNNQVLGNIISNAIKFSHRGSNIAVNAYPVGQNNFVIEVKDNGVGIPQPLMGQLFDINKKTSRPGTLGETGIGFGMHILKTFVDMYGGKLQIESSEGDDNMPSGTTVKLFLKGEWT